MTQAALIIGDSSWLWPAAVLLAVALLVLWRAYRGVDVSRRLRLAAAALKAAAVLLLAACLVNPLWSGLRPRPGANIVGLLADNSRSLTIRDAEESTTTRGDALRALLTGVEREGDAPAEPAPQERRPPTKLSPWQARLAQDFDVRRYLVDDRLRRTDDFAALDFTGQTSSLRTGLATLADRFRNQPVAGVLLFTDGLATDAGGVESRESRVESSGPSTRAELPPVYPVVIGNASGLKDIRITQVAVSRTSFEDAPVTVRADVEAIGYADTDVVAQLLDPEGERVEQQTAMLSTDDDSHAFRFRLRPEQPGLSFYRLRVAAAGELDQFDRREASREATLANNARLVKIDRGAGPHRILYVSGRPNWEYKFLRRSVADDDSVELVGLIRIARREPKFDFRGRAGESSNPLFRGFDKNDDAGTERYDEPVLIRLNTQDESELQGGFPETAEELFAYRAVVLDDCGAEFFTQAQRELLERFAAERGGGVLMLGGQESFQRGGYERTPLADLLPVYLDRSSGPGRNQEPAVRSQGAGYRLELTRDGWLKPWVRLRKTQDAERERLDRMPGFHVLNRVSGIKPGAVVLARAAGSSGQTHPALVAHRYGRGRCAALTIGDLWRWQLRREADAERNDLGKAWRQMLRWLVADVPERVEVRAEPRPQAADGAVSLQVQVRDAEFQPLDDARIRITVEPPQGEPLELDAEPSLDEAGLFETPYVPREPGVYRAETRVTDGDGEDVGTAGTGWVNDQTDAEFRSVQPDREFLETLAADTGGRVLTPEELDDFAAELASRDVPVTERRTFPLWHQAWFFLLAIGCLVGEWGLRRWKGLP